MVNNILIYSAHNEGKSITPERFIMAKNNIKAKTYKQMTANYTISSPSYLNKLVDQYDKNFMILLINNLVMLTVLLWLKK